MKKKLSFGIGVIVLLTISLSANAHYFLSIISVEAQNQGSNLSYYYDCSTVPEEAPDNGWLIRNLGSDVTYESHMGKLYINGYNPDIFKPNRGTADFYRVEESLSTAAYYIIEVNLYVDRGGGRVADFKFGVSDGQKDISILGSRTSGVVLIVTDRREYRAEVDLTEIVTYRLEVDKTQEDSSQRIVTLYQNNDLLISAPYSALPDHGSLTNIFGFGSLDSDTVWDYVKYEVTTKPVLSAWTSTTPTIDGEICPAKTIGWGSFARKVPAEWGDADKVDFTLSYGTPMEKHAATLYVMNDYINLYLAFKIANEDYHYLDGIFFRFDNDNDGVREVGDNVLSLQGQNYFADRYIYNFRAGTVRFDDASGAGGNIDGVGAAWYSDPDLTGGDWNFEIVFPLNSFDNSHDFSLLIGSRVGFNIEYQDFNVMHSFSWPSISWSQMAVIRVAAPPTTLPQSNADLSIIAMEVTQAIQLLDNSMPLVQGKATSVRIYIDSGEIRYSVSVTVHLFNIDGTSTDSGYRILGELKQTFNVPWRELSRASEFDTANFILPIDWVSRSDLFLMAFVKASSSDQAERNYDNNWMTELFSFQQTRVPIIYIVPVNHGTRTNPDLIANNEIARQEDYLRTIFPVADVNFIHLSWQVLGENAPGVGSDLIAMLTDIGYDYGLVDGGIDMIFGFSPITTDGGLSDPLWFNNGHGIAACGNIGTSEEGTMAHEINHNLGPGDNNYPEEGLWGRHAPHAPGSDDNWPYADCIIQEYGFDTRNNQVVALHEADLMCYCPSVTTADDGTHYGHWPELCTITHPWWGPTKWISPYRWENLFNRLLPISTTQSKSVITLEEEWQCLKISGWISEGGTGHLNPIFRISGQRESELVPGNFSIILKDKDGNNLLVKKFEVGFIDADGEKMDPYHFIMLLPNIEGTSSVLLMNDEKILDEIRVSDHSPVVQIISPKEGDIWSGIETIRWEASDIDGNALTFRVYYSIDLGETWTPLSLNIEKNSYEVDTETISGSDSALVRVVASDGFNIGEDNSDIYTVNTNLPKATVLQPRNETQFTMDDTILFRGIGTDADDITLPQEAYSWESSLEGLLGMGSTITATLQPGIHEIKLTVTDSEGKQDSEYISITVMPIVNAALVKTFNDLQNAINNLPDSAFRSEASELRTAMLNILNTLELALAKGDINEAKTELKNLRLHVDGFGTSPDPDDWIVDQTKQIEIRELIDNYINLL